MTPSRRHFLRAGAIALPVLACAALAAPARAAEEASPASFGRGRSMDPAPSDPRAACPFCQPDKPCPEHLV